MLTKQLFKHIKVIWGEYTYSRFIFADKYIVHILHMYIYIFVKSKKLDIFLNGTQKTT